MSDVRDVLGMRSIDEFNLPDWTLREWVDAYLNAANDELKKFTEAGLRQRVVTIQNWFLVYMLAKDSGDLRKLALEGIKRLRLGEESKEFIDEQILDELRKLIKRAETMGDKEMEKLLLWELKDYVGISE